MLLSEDKGLDEFPRVLGLVGDLANDLDKDVLQRSLGVDVGDADLAVLEVELRDALLDVLAADRDVGNLGLGAIDELRLLAVEELWTRNMPMVSR